MVPLSLGAAWLLPLGVVTYLARFGSSWLVLSMVEAVRFDPHGFGLLGDLVLLSALAVPILALAWWVLLRRRRWRGLLARASTPGWTAVSWAALVLLGAPTPEQVFAAVLLPVRDAWPVWLSALCWFGVVAAGRALAVGAPDRTGRPGGVRSGHDA